MIILFVGIFRLIIGSFVSLSNSKSPHSHINKVIFFSQTRGRGKNEIFSKDMEQKEKKRRWD